MNADLYGAYRTADGHLGKVADWYLNLIATYGLIPVLAGGTIAIVALVCGIGGAWYAAGRIRDRRTERRDRAAAWRQLCNQPPQRETEPGSHSGDLLTCLNILAATENQTRKGKSQP